MFVTYQVIVTNSIDVALSLKGTTTTPNLLTFPIT